MSKTLDSIFVSVRVKPTVTLIEEIRVYLMLRWKSNKQKIVKYEGNILRNIKKELQISYKKTIGL